MLVRLAMPPKQRPLSSEMLARQQHANKRAEQIRKQQQLAQMDIHEEMDQFDAPHIPLRPDATSAEAPEAPAAPAAPAQPAAVAKAERQARGDNDKRRRRKKASRRIQSQTQKIRQDANVKRHEAVAIRRAIEASGGDNRQERKRSSSDKPAMVAEAEPEKPNARPAWVDESPKRTGNTRREVIATEPYATVDECYQAADIYLLLKTYQRMQQLAGQPYVRRTAALAHFPKWTDICRRKLISYGGASLLGRRSNLAT